MVSKPTGRPVGRPRKECPPARPVGRPRQPFRHDPDRYAVALLDAMLALELGSERACSIAIAAWQVGLQLDSQVGGWIAWAVSPTLKGATAATLPGRADTLRGKQRRTCSGSDAAWRTAVAGAFMLALGAREREAVKRAILWRAETAGEGEFARAVIWPMVDAKFGADVALPEFPGNFTTTSEVS